MKYVILNCANCGNEILGAPAFIQKYGYPPKRCVDCRGFIREETPTIINKNKITATITHNLVRGTDSILRLASDRKICVDVEKIEYYMKCNWSWDFEQIMKKKSQITFHYCGGKFWKEYEIDLNELMKLLDI